MTDINDSIRKRGFRGDNPQARIDADILNGLVMLVKTCERRQPGGILPKGTVHPRACGEHTSSIFLLYQDK